MTKTTIELSVFRNGTLKTYGAVNGYEFYINSKAFVVHRLPATGYWQVSEPDTGLPILSQAKRTRRAAVKQAKKYWELRYEDLGKNLNAVFKKVILGESN
jgi:hypothetical protein